MELKDSLQKLKKDLENTARENKVNTTILDIHYYKTIKFNEAGGEEHPIYLVEKQVDGKIVKQLQTDDEVIADIKEDNSIEIKEGFKEKITIKGILIKLRDTMPVSLNELEHLEKDKQKENEMESEERIKNGTNVETKGSNVEQNKKDIEIDMDKRITETKTFAQLVPEVKEKGIETVKVRRLDMTRFEFYGLDENGNEIEIQSLKAVEGTNPNKEIKEINQDGSKVEENQVLAMFQIENGTNEQAGNEGFTVDLDDDFGLPKISYYRRDKGENEYTSIPVNLKNTNQKRTEIEVREYAEKRINPEVGDNIEKADKILDRQEKTSLENIDDDLYNDCSETREEYEEELIEEAAKRCKVSVEGFKKELENTRKEGEPIEDSIERTEEEINEQAIGGERSRI